MFAFATPNAKASKKQGEFSWSLSASLALGSWRPYVTFAEQALTLGGQSGAVSVNNVEAGPLGKSSLKEAGLKFAGLDGRLQAALALYDQKRIDYSALADSNLAVRGKGVEFELRAAFSERLALLFSATRSRIYREPLTGRFIFAPAAVTGFAPEDQYGGNLVTVLPAGDRRFRQRGALPEYVVSAGGSYRFSRSFDLNLTASRVGKAWSGVARTVRLPALHAGERLPVVDPRPLASQLGCQQRPQQALLPRQLPADLRRSGGPAAPATQLAADAEQAVWGVEHTAQGRQHGSLQIRWLRGAAPSHR